MHYILDTSAAAFLCVCLCVCVHSGLCLCSGVIPEGCRQGFIRGSVLPRTHAPWYTYSIYCTNTRLSHVCVCVILFFTLLSEGYGTKRNLNKALRYFQLASHGGTYVCVDIMYNDIVYNLWFQVTYWLSIVWLRCMLREEQSRETATMQWRYCILICIDP